MIKYVVEIKYRIICILILFLSFVATAFYYKFYVIHLFLWLNPKALTTVLNLTSITELFDIFLNITLFILKYILFYFTYYHFVSFLALGLYKREYFYLKHFFNVSVLIWGFSTAFFITVFLPIAYDFFFQIERSSADILNSIRFEPNLLDYVDFVLNLYVQTFLCFQVLFIFVILLQYFEVNLVVIKRSKRAIYAFLLLLATCITPPDVLSQIFSFLFLTINMEIYLFIKLLKKNLIG